MAIPLEKLVIARIFIRVKFEFCEKFILGDKNAKPRISFIF